MILLSEFKKKERKCDLLSFPEICILETEQCCLFIMNMDITNSVVYKYRIPHELSFII